MTDRRIREAVRYLGYGRSAVDEKTMTMIEESFEELEKFARKKTIYRIFECICRKEGEVKIGELTISSISLSRNLKDCREVALFAATLGAETDRILKKYSAVNMTKAVVFQACAAAYLEEYCDQCQSEIEKVARGEGKYIRPRFSPGYGDCSVSCQKEILTMLDAAKHIGLMRTDANMLVPVKSVTAFIGISTKKTGCHRSGCEVCEKTDCSYRRDR